MSVERPQLDHDLLRSVRARITLELDPEITNPFSTKPDRSRIIREAVVRSLGDLGLASADAHLHVDYLIDELIGLGPLEPLMADPDTTDILVNAWNEVFVERHGQLHRTTTRFRDQAHLEQVIQKIVALVGREISVDKPVVDARMVDGSRANAVYAPVGGPCLCIRKFNRLRLDLLPGGDAGANWVATGGMSLGMAEFLAAAAASRATVLVAGATGSGKSTLLRSLVSAFPSHERVITIEDTAELELDNPHWVRLECVHNHQLGNQGTSTRRVDVADLVQNALRMRPDRLIVGEIRNSREAYHALEALNTGHDGSATTVHASSAADALARLELLIGRDFDHLTPRETRGYIARVIHLIVFIARLQNGRRCVMEICELAGLTSDGAYDVRPVFTTVQPHGRDSPPSFVVAPHYAPGPRLERKLSAEGYRWTS